MSDISDLESRLSAALERIGRGVADLGPAKAEAATPVDVHDASDMSEEVASLRRALEHEANASAQLEERLRAVSQKQAELEAAAEAKVTAAEEKATAAEEKVTVAEEKAEAAQAEVASLRETVDADSQSGDEADARIDELSGKVAELEAALESETSSRKAAEADAEGARNALKAAAEGDGTEALSNNHEVMEQMAQRLRRMRRMSRGVRENNERLRAVAEEKVVDPALINDSLKAEIDSLKALRDAEIAEANVILSELTPMVAVSEAQEDAATEEDA